MESANKQKGKTIFYKTSITLLLLLQACWTFESSVEEKDLLFDNFKIIEDKNDEQAGVTLVLNHDEVYYVTIEERCREVYFDSVNIYVKSAKTDLDTTSIYSHIEILSLTNEDKDAVFEKRKIHLSEFESRIKLCKKCIKRSYHE